MTTGITDEELLRLFAYRDALEKSLTDMALSGASSVSLNGRSVTRQSAAELRNEIGITNRQIRHRLAYLGGNESPQLGTIVFR